MKRSTWAAVLAAALIAGVCVLVFRRSDEGKIRAQLRALATAVHAEPGENALFRAKRIQDTFARVFPADVQIDVPGVHEGLAPRSKLVAFAAGAGIQYGAVDLRFDAVTVDLEKPQRRAWVTSTASANGGDRGESREVVMRFVESEGEWRITSIAIAGSAQR
jgi:hypothetical protein